MVGGVSGPLSTPPALRTITDNQHVERMINVEEALKVRLEAVFEESCAKNRPTEGGIEIIAIER